MRTGGSSIRNFCSHFFIFLMAVEHLSQYRTNITNQDQDTNSNTRNPSLFVSCMHDFSPFFVLGFELKEEERKKLEPVPFIRSSIQRLPHNCLSKPSLSLSLSQPKKPALYFLKSSLSLLADAQCNRTFCPCPHSTKSAIKGKICIPLLNCTSSPWPGDSPRLPHFYQRLSSS